MKNIKMKKVFLFGAVALLTACSSGGVYTNAACGIHPKAKCTQGKVREEQINLAADALFKFDKYTESDLLNVGREQLDELAHKLANHYVEIRNITLVGHTDRLGSVAYNNRLGLNRAKTVRAYLQSRGVNVNILAKTAGESQPVTDGCRGVRPQVKLRACLQPDRRVVVRVLGVKKTKVKQCNRGENLASPVVNNPVRASQVKASQFKERVVNETQMHVKQMPANQMPVSQVQEPLPMVQEPQVQDNLVKVNLTSD